jgi:hypothetical protein
MLRATFLNPRPQAAANINAGSSSPTCQSRMFQRHAMRHRRSSLPATQHVVIDLVESPGDDSFPVAPAITSIDVVDVVSDLPNLPETAQTADMGPKGFVDSAMVATVESVCAAPDRVPTMTDIPAAEVAPTLASAEMITAMPTATNAATAEPKVQAVKEIMTVVPAIIAIVPAETMPADAVPAKEKKGKKWGKKTENVGLGGGAGKTKKPRRNSAKAKIRSGTPQQGEGQSRLPIYGLDDGSYAHSPP